MVLTVNVSSNSPNPYSFIKGGVEERMNIEYESSTSDTLDHNHNLFFLVDNGSRNDFGVEIDFRAKFEAAARDAYDNAPVITIVIQGGPGTLKTALSAVLAGTPIVVIDGSGQAADILAYAWNFLHSSRAKCASYTIDALEDLIKPMFSNMDDTQARDAKVREMLHDTLEAVQDRNKVRPRW